VLAEVLYRCIKTLHRPLRSVLKIQPAAGRPKHGVYDLAKLAPSVQENVAHMRQLQKQVAAEASKFTTQRAACKLWMRESKPLLNKYFEQAKIKEDRVTIDEVVDVITETPDPAGGDNVTVTTSTMTAERTVRVFKEERIQRGELSLWDMSSIIDEAVTHACPLTEPFRDEHVPDLLKETVIKPLLDTILTQIQVRQESKSKKYEDIFTQCAPVRLPPGSRVVGDPDIANLADVAHADFDTTNNALTCGDDGAADDAYNNSYQYMVEPYGHSAHAAYAHEAGGATDDGSEGFYDAR
jgi:hypothetical protein